jgi:AmmeMemoRadiSam system protein A
MSIDFSDSEKRTLLEHARKILQTVVTTQEPAKEKSPNTKYLEKFGVFISLHKKDELRGCIGNVQPILTIWDAITENTSAAAQEDIRFASVTELEISDIKIEISILTKPEECTVADIQTGDGVIVQQGEYKATYLPQVWETIPDKNNFLSSLCKKAGLEGDYYLDKITKIYKYRAIVFTE